MRRERAAVDRKVRGIQLSRYTGALSLDWLLHASLFGGFHSPIPFLMFVLMSTGV